MITTSWHKIESDDGTMGIEVKNDYINVMVLPPCPITHEQMSELEKMIGEARRVMGEYDG